MTYEMKKRIEGVVLLMPIPSFNYAQQLRTAYCNAAIIFNIVPSFTCNGFTKYNATNLGLLAKD
jgi:hypothetical protein